MSIFSTPIFVRYTRIYFSTLKTINKKKFSYQTLKFTVFTALFQIPMALFFIYNIAFNDNFLSKIMALRDQRNLISHKDIDLLEELNKNKTLLHDLGAYPQKSNILYSKLFKKIKENFDKQRELDNQFIISELKNLSKSNINIALESQMKYFIDFFSKKLYLEKQEWIRKTKNKIKEEKEIFMKNESKRLNIEMEQKLEEIKKDYRENQKKTNSRVIKVKEDIMAFNTILKTHKKYGETIKKLIKINDLINEINTSINETGVINNYWSDLLKMTENDPFINTLVKAININDLRYKIPSVSSLKLRYTKMESKIREAIMIDDGKNNSVIMRTVLAYFSSRLLLKERVFLEGVGNYEIVSRAGYYIEKNDLESCLNELSKLGGRSGYVCRDFIIDAKRNLMVRQTMKAIRGYVMFEANKLS